MIISNKTGHDFVLDGSLFGLNFESCPVVFQGQNHVITSFGALAQLVEKPFGIEYITKVKPLSKYDYWSRGYSFESYSSCG